MNRWEEFSDVLSNEEEQVELEVKRPTVTVDPVTRTKKEAYVHQGTFKAIPIYPEELLVHHIDGEVLEVDVIYLTFPDSQYLRNDILVKKSAAECYRVIGHSNLLSHKEVHCKLVESKAAFLN